MYEAARITDQIKHSGAAVGTAIGAIAGVAAGVAALFPGPGTVVAVVLGVVSLAAPLVGGLVHYDAGPIATGAKRVFIGGKKAARAMIDVVACDAPKVIAQGSKTVVIEDYPAARIDDQTQCGGSIAQGFPTVFIGREPATYVHIDSEVPLWLQIAYVVASFSTLAAGGIKAILGVGEEVVTEALTTETLVARVDALRDAIPAAQQGRITMAVGLAEDAEGDLSFLVGTSEPRGYLRPGVTLNPGEILAPGTGHAEEDILQRPADAPRTWPRAGG